MLLHLHAEGGVPRVARVASAGDGAAVALAAAQALQRRPLTIEVRTDKLLTPALLSLCASCHAVNTVMLLMSATGAWSQLYVSAPLSRRLLTDYCAHTRSLLAASATAPCCLTFSLPVPRADPIVPDAAERAAGAGAVACICQQGSGCGGRGLAAAWGAGACVRRQHSSGGAAGVLSGACIHMVVLRVFCAITLALKVDAT